MSPIEWQLESFKTFLGLVTAFVTLSFGWLIGQRLTTYWAIRQKRRELELSAVNEFYRLYGEFFAVWKLWNHYLDLQTRSVTEPRFPENVSWELLKRASDAEGVLESLFVKLASERDLSDENTEILANSARPIKGFGRPFKTTNDSGGLRIVTLSIWLSSDLLSLWPA